MRRTLASIALCAALFGGPISGPQPGVIQRISRYASGLCTIELSYGWITWPSHTAILSARCNYYPGQRVTVDVSGNGRYISVR